MIREYFSNLRRTHARKKLKKLFSWKIKPKPKNLSVEKKDVHALTVHVGLNAIVVVQLPRFHSLIAKDQKNAAVPTANVALALHAIALHASVVSVRK